MDTAILSFRRQSAYPMLLALSPRLELVMQFAVMSVNPVRAIREIKKKVIIIELNSRNKKKRNKKVSTIKDIVVSKQKLQKIVSTGHSCCAKRCLYSYQQTAIEKYSQKNAFGRPDIKILKFNKLFPLYFMPNKRCKARQRERERVLFHIMPKS